VGCLPLFYLLNGVSADSSIGMAFFLAILSGFFASVTGPNVRAVLQNVTLPEQRGSAFALLNTTDDIGKGAGPFLIAVFVTAFGDRRAAFNFVTMGWAAGALVNLGIYWTIEKDEDDCQELVRKTISHSIEMASRSDNRKCEELTLISSTDA
jgi:MFS-type transporter involved in bile tolerance (Atg22 family)